jgi:tRNA (guanine37-N1)-methyltransferase
MPRRTYAFGVRIDVLTTFPELFAQASPAVLGVSIPARAIKAGLLTVEATDIRAFTHDKHNKTDDRPFGGGPGMVMTCQPVWDAVMAAESRDPRPATRILLTPQGTPLSQRIVEDLATKPRLLMLAGHYEGIDERVIEALDPIELSIGDYVLSGGELAALVLIDAITRLLPGATGDEQSPQQDSFGNVVVPPQAKGREATTRRLLDCPHYTKPREWQGREVPPVLLSGDHEKIAAWRLQQRMERTFVRRPDLLH